MAAASRTQIFWLRGRLAVAATMSPAAVVTQV
jgi:hypothetical protein